MINNKTSSVYILKILGSIVFDIAIIYGFFSVFGLFYSVAIDKSLLVLLFLLLGLALLNGMIFFPNKIFSRLGVPYFISVIVITILYILLSSIFSIFLIKGTIIGYLVWQLVLLSIYSFILALVLYFGQKIEKE
ncbi:MAG: hypothetical protein WDA24_03695 [Tissierellales bacterium]